MKRRTLFGIPFLSILGAGISVKDSPAQEMTLEDLYTDLPKNNGKKILVGHIDYPSHHNNNYDYPEGSINIYRTEVYKANKLWVAFTVDSYNGIDYIYYQNALDMARALAKLEPNQYGDLYHNSYQYIFPVHIMYEGMYPIWLKNLEALYHS